MKLTWRHFSEDGRGVKYLNGYVTNPNPTPTLTPNPNRNPNSNPNQINEKIQKETTLEIDQITKCQFGRWKLVKTQTNRQTDKQQTNRYLAPVLGKYEVLRGR